MLEAAALAGLAVATTVRAVARAAAPATPRLKVRRMETTPLLLLWVGYFSVGPWRRRAQTRTQCGWLNRSHAFPHQGRCPRALRTHRREADGGRPRPRPW